MMWCNGFAARDALRKQEEADRRAADLAVCDVCGDVCRRLPRPLPSGQRFSTCSCLERELPKDRTDADGRTGAEIFGTPDRNPYL